MAEAKRAERTRSLLRAQVIFNKGATTIDCVVKNVSATGARLELTNSVPLPDEFTLAVPHKDRSYRARLVWRDANTVGVRYMDAAAEQTTGSPLHAPGSQTALEVENAELRARVRALTRRLEDLGQDVSISI